MRLVTHVYPCMHSNHQT